MLLTDHQIQWELFNPDGELKIEPFSLDQLQPASVDLHLGTSFAVYTTKYGADLPLDPYAMMFGDDIKKYELLDEFPSSGMLIEPRQFMLASTKETVSLGPRFAARIEGKSTLGRLGLIVHSTAGFVDPGFSGQLTLEMTNLNIRPIVLRPGMRIAQLSIMKLDHPVQRPYGHPTLNSHYQDQTGARGPAPLSS